MPRGGSGRSSGGRTSTPARPAPRPAPVSHSRPAPPPAPAPQHAPPPAKPAAAAGGGGGFLGNMMQTVGEGMAWGTGTAIAHRAVDAVMGPRSVVHEHINTAAAPAAAPAAAASPAAAPADTSASNCQQLNMDFTKCVEGNTDDISKCQFYLDMLNECKRNVAAGGTLQ